MVKTSAAANVTCDNDPVDLHLSVLEREEALSDAF
jgi:hypothetical protein